jgi:purine-binding chemotaxis protein CheW
VVNLRGRILPVVELRTRLGLAPAELTPRTRLLIVEVHGRTLGLLVDAVSRVVRIPRSAVVPPPDEVVSGRSDYITGVARLDPRLLILLDLDKALLLTVDSP